MASRLGMQKAAASAFGMRPWVNVAAMASPLDSSLQRTIPSPPLVLPEYDTNLGVDNNNTFGFGFPSFSFGGSMELMAVPKKKVSPHKRGIRNGPKALKPTPVIVRCRSCGRVKLQHFYCCSGDRGQPGEPK